MLTLRAIALDNYDITEQLYSGSRTLVYRARRTADQQPAVIKVLREEHPTFSELVQFRNQYTIAKHLSSIGIIQAYSLEPYRNGYALVMEDFGGISLRQFALGKPLGLNVFCPIALQISDILHDLYLNRIVHKDIKLANILINPDTKQVKLIDFSIASLLPRETPEIQSPNILEGTLAYLSPEQTGRMNRAIDYRSDFYSLGVTFFELLTGQLPFGSSDPMELVHCHLVKQPPSIHSLNPAIPPILSEIVAKLMAKNAEDRYQSALGLKHDLELCLTQSQEKGNYARFTLGQRDISDRFLIPERLYGREAAVVEVLSAFNRVSEGKTELLLVAGFSGIGKTAVVNEVHKPIVRQRGYFIKGKYDQFNRNIPLSAFVQALRDLMGQLLSESDEQLLQWKNCILNALGENGQVAIEAIPELERIIGKQPPVPELSGSAAQNRFNFLFQKFIGVFATKEHPLVMFLDDLQWADSASLSLMQVLMSQSEIGYLLLIGAYRDNEVSPAHPVMLTLGEIQKAEAIVNTLTLVPLNQANVHRLIADTLTCSAEMALPLTELIYQKTQGNPFFTAQFLKALYEDKLISFDWGAGYWQCDVSQVRSLALTDDVVEFMAIQLQKLPEATQNVLKLAACIGNQFDLDTLAIVSEQSETEAAANLWKALQEGLILPLSEIYKFYQADGHRESGIGNRYESIPSPITHSPLLTYKFLHDRVQQAAYSLIPEAQKGITHLRIGQLLLGGTRIEEREEKVFKIVSQLNQGSHLITKESQREELTQLNLMAAQKAKVSTAYAAAKKYLAKGLELLSSDCWQNQYLLAKALYEAGAEVNYLSGDCEQANKLIDSAMQNMDILLDKIKLYQVKIQILIAQNQLAEVTNISLKVLQELGVFFPEKITSNDVRQAIEKTRHCIFSRSREELLNQPEMDDPASIAIMDLLMLIVPAAYFTNIRLFVLILSQKIELSIQKGRLAWSPYAYACFGFMLVDMDEIEEGYFIGKLALDIIYNYNYKTVKSRVLEVFNGHIRFWKEHLRGTVQPLLEGYQAGVETGDLEYASYSALMYCYHSYFLGNPLSEVAEEMKKYELAIQKFGQSKALYWHQMYHQPVLNLLGRVDDPCVLTGEACDENQTIEFLRSNNDFTTLAVFYVQKLNLCYLFESYALALEAGNQGASHLKNISATPTIAIYYLYDSLVKLAVCPELASSNPTAYAEYLANVAANQAKMQNWAARAPMNFQHKYDLVEAERYRVGNQRGEAVELYDRAIATAKANKYTQEEALANELAAKFYLDWGKQRIAQEYMTEAYYCYARWGAKAKVADLETRYPQLLAPILQQARSAFSVNETVFAAGTVTSTSSSSSSISDSLDLAAILKASQTLSGEIELGKLLSTLLQLVIENAGADKCVLVLMRDDRLLVKGLATVGAEPIVLQRISVEESQDIPLKLIYAVKNRLEPVVLMDAAASTEFASDPYFRRQQPKSILCSPILHQGKLLGIVYLENNLTIGAFSRDRLHILNLLCAQATISLENARLYQRSQEYAQELEQSLEKLRLTEARFQKMADNLLGMIYQIRLAPDGSISVPYVSSGCATLYEVTPEELMTGAKDFQAMQHPDDRPRITQAFIHSAQTLTPFKHEWRIVTPSGNLKWIQVASRPELQADGSIVWDGMTIDISDRKRAEASLAKEREFLNAIIHNITDGIVVCDASGNLILFNNATREFHGLPVESLPPQQWAEYFDLYQPDGKTLLSKTEVPLFRAFQGEIVENAEMIIAPKQGSTRFLLASGQAIFDPLGNKIGAVVAMRDISDRKAAELAIQQKSQALEEAITNLQQAQLQIIQSEKMSALGNLVAGVAHEINNPIGFIAGNLQPALDYVKDTFGLIDLYQQEYPNPSAIIQEEIDAIELDYLREDLPKLIGSMQLGVDRICSISTSLRTFSRADKDYKVPFNIHEGIDSTILILKHRLKASESRPAIEVETNYGNIPILECFPGQLNQVFMNILANAIDALEEASQKRTFGDIAANPNRIEIQTELDDSGQQAIVRIRDNGMGMSEVVKQRVFDHLFTTKAVGKGTGLGLAIARQIVLEKHGGSLNVNSILGEGTEFLIVLPIKAA
ncbi:AAA family ATPase [Microcoleus sp. A003_D6]|uniref:trifunctional serine/threonine-protein kinase/ATP-binding protein/sensor histidine kinase n=1 Tax=Microcoleus sp. A003_D6 TaxID=3055266 RepID=UPI002FD72339